MPETETIRIVNPHDDSLVTIMVKGEEYTLPIAPDEYEAKELCAFLARTAYGLEKDDLHAIVDVIAKVTSHPQMSAMGDNWRDAIAKLLEFWTQPRNLEQLIVFNRFCWTFGDFETWKAVEGLNDLLSTAFQRAMWKDSYHHLRKEYERCHRWQWLKKRRLETRMAEVLNNVQMNLEYLDTVLLKLCKQDGRWPDRAALVRLQARKVSL